jgi:hypothetical protein
MPSHNEEEKLIMKGLDGKDAPEDTMTFSLQFIYLHEDMSLCSLSFVWHGE